MPLENQIPELLSFINSKSDYLKHNEILLDIYEGNLLKYVEEDLKRQLSAESYAQIYARISPINILIKIIDKLSKIYQQNPTRSASIPESSEVLSWYEETARINQKMNAANEYFNLFKSVLINVVAHRGKPLIRPFPGDRFLVYSADVIDPTFPTHYILIMGNGKPSQKTANKRSSKEKENPVIIYHVYKDREFMIMDSEGEYRSDLMSLAGIPDGVLPISRPPFVYINKSQTKALPTQDSDVKRMTTLIAVLLSDINLVSMFQSFSVYYTIDVDSANMKMSPNVIWSLKSDPSTDKTPQVGVITPQADIPQLLENIQTQFSLWLNSLGIKPGSIGQLTTENAASGISKMIDEADVSEFREKQINYFKDAEIDLWNLIANDLNPYWINKNLIENKKQFVRGTNVEINYAQQIPAYSRGDFVEDLKKEVDANFTTRKIAIKRLNPHMTEDNIDKLMREIDEEKSTVVVVEESVINEETLNGGKVATGEDSASEEV